ncbi:hypothetical protein BV20DRAFT_442205 [Pilatotrama ljubarskyi]|nr:hypothetical protein BV20DRAFT_442205 [Pilatotrama ljubarskyi]
MFAGSRPAPTWCAAGAASGIRNCSTHLSVASSQRRMYQALASSGQAFAVRTTDRGHCRCRHPDPPSARLHHATAWVHVPSVMGARSTWNGRLSRWGDGWLLAEAHCLWLAEDRGTFCWPHARLLSTALGAAGYVLPDGNGASAYGNIYVAFSPGALRRREAHSRGVRPRSASSGPSSMHGAVHSAAGATSEAPPAKGEGC